MQAVVNAEVQKRHLAVRTTELHVSRIQAVPDRVHLDKNWRESSRSQSQHQVNLRHHSAALTQEEELIKSSRFFKKLPEHFLPFRKLAASKLQ